MKHLISLHGATTRARRLVLVLALALYSCPGVGTALAASEAAIALAEDGRRAQPAAGAAARSDLDVEVLLNQLLRQLATGRTAAPEGDNAMATWKILLDTVIPPTPGAARAMAGFVREARRRAAEERAAGRTMTAMDLTLFASEASDILQGERAEPPPAAIPDYRPGREAFAAPRDTAHPAEPPSPAAAPAEQPPTAAAAAPQPPLPSSSPPPAEMPQTSAAGPAAPVPPGGPVTLASRDAPKAAASPGAPPPPRPASPQTGLDRARAAAAVSRGDAMLAMKDISAARALYEYAANAGSARGASALAETYDPGFLRRLGAIGPKPDLALAAAWYRKAAELGDATAEAKVRTLAAEAAK